MTATFDLNPAGSHYTDIPVTLNLYRSALTDVKNATATLVLGTDYTVSGDTVTVLKSYLAKQPVGTTTLTFDFTSGNAATLTITVENTTSATGGGGGTAPASPTVKLTDIAGNWAYASIEKLVALGVITGYPNGTFRPNNDITRAESVSVLVKGGAW